MRCEPAVFLNSEHHEAAGLSTTIFVYKQKLAFALLKARSLRSAALSRILLVLTMCSTVIVTTYKTGTGIPLKSAPKVQNRPKQLNSLSFGELVSPL